MHTSFRSMTVGLVLMLSVAMLTTSGNAQSINAAVEGAKNGPSTHSVTTTNSTKYEAWFDVSRGSPIETWHIIKAFCLKPNSSYTETYRRDFKLRVRAEVKLHGCNSGTHKTVYVIEWASGSHYHAVLTENRPNEFGMSWGP